MPSEISDDLGLTGEVRQSPELISMVKETVEANPEIVKKYLRNGREITLMQLVGEITEKNSKSLDPVVVK